jgi:chemotaxis protein MotB
MIRTETPVARLTPGLMLVLACAACAACVSQGTYDALAKDREAEAQKAAAAREDAARTRQALEKQLADRDARVLLLQRKLESLGQDVSRLTTERGSLGGELEEAKKRMDELKRAQAAAEARAAQFRKLVAQFKQLTDAGKLKVEIRNNRMIVRLADQILFDPGKTELKKEGQEALRQVTAILKEIPNRDFQVAGHTDNTPMKSARFRSNWDLSTARAVEVVGFMIGAGMEPRRVSAAGYAAESPVSANDTPENKAKNRRIEITLVPNLDDLPPIDDALKEGKESPAPSAAPPASAAPAAPSPAPPP